MGNIKVEKEIKKVKKTRIVEEEVDVFITTNGKRYERLEIAEKAQTLLDVQARKEFLEQKMKVCHFNYLDMTLCYIEDIDEAYEYFDTSYSNGLNIDKSLIPNWFMYEFYDGGDYRDEHDFTLLDDFMKDIVLIKEHTQQKG